MRKVLVVEDSSTTRAFVRAILEGDGFTKRLGPCDVSEASSGFEAMRLLPRGPYQLIITDINMADINGLELIRFVRMSEHHRTTPLLIISTQNTERDVDRGLALGADGYVPKPFSEAELTEACAQVLGAARER